jgi:dinuclear metal center YbgI/SA1388 family protein
MTSNKIKLREVVQVLEAVAPPRLQESYDNSGLITGNSEMMVNGAILALDATEAVLDEAIDKNINLVIAHHPIVFKGLKKLNGKNYVERVIIKAIKHDIAIYAIHTNLDNVFYRGVNEKIAEKLGLVDCRILAPKSGELVKLVYFVPKENHAEVESAIFRAGGGRVGKYEECNFKTEGTGSFLPASGSNPSLGEVGKREFVKEYRVEVLVEKSSLQAVLSAMKKAHPYEEVAHAVYPILNVHQDIGAGMVGNLTKALSKEEFLAHIKKNLNAEVVKFTNCEKNEFQKIALCGGSGSFLIGAAKASGADAYITGDIKYHEFFDGESELMICDVGHYESEQFTSEQIATILSEKLPNFALIFTRAVTNPVQYYY